jgi:DNA repair exonuclease SbcCD ATPase subunit
MAEDDRCPECGQRRDAQERLLSKVEKEIEMRRRLTNEIATLRLRVHELEVDRQISSAWNARKVQRQARAIRQLEKKLAAKESSDKRGSDACT